MGSHRNYKRFLTFEISFYFTVYSIKESYLSFKLLISIFRKGSVDFIFSLSVFLFNLGTFQTCAK